MRLHATRAVRNSAFGATTLLLAALTSLLAAFLFASSAGAATTTDRPLLLSFATGQRSAHGIAVDNATGAVYVTEENVDPGNSSPELVKFHADGTPWEFAGSGTNRLPLNSFGASVAVDNSGGSSQGTVYVGEPASVIPGGQLSQLRAFDESGSLLWKQIVPEQVWDLAVDQDGDLWTFSYVGSHIHEYDTSSNPPVELTSYEAGEVFTADVDASENLYLNQPVELEKWVGGAFDSLIDPSSREVSVDQSSATGHVFTSDFGNFTEFDADGNEVGTYASQFLSGGEFLSEVRAIAFNPASNRLYMLAGSQTWPSQSLAAPPKVLVFGAPQSGTVPDVAIEPASGVGVSSAQFSGTVNPQGTANEWYFEWKKEGSAWLAADSSPAQPLPSDATDHTVEFTAESLRGNTTYEVRLVAMNTANSLRSWSSAEPFTTTTAAAAPSVTIEPASDVTIDSAKIAGTVDPEGDTADWSVQLSTDPTCSEGFIDQPVENLTPGTSSAEPVESTLTGLLPSEHYCARIAATNSVGTAMSGVVEFTTEPVAPDQLEPIGVAPRLDTSARLNARVNPRGEDLTYHFEYSSDDGASWQTLPDEVEQSGARSQIVISQEASGLQPNTTYLFRVTIENPVGGGQSDERSFSTRTSQELELPARGYELVNSPDKGNQHALMPRSGTGQLPMSPDGNKVLWEVLGGAPGGYNGTGALFLSERTASGWQSRSLLPPASAQLGEGMNRYRLNYRTDDMSTFVLNSAKATAEGLGEVPDTTYVRIDAHQGQEILRRFEDDLISHAIDVTTDGSHVLTVDSKFTGQIVEIGSDSPEVVSIMPDGAEASCGVDAGNGFGGAGELGGGAGSQWQPGYHMIATTDASIVYFETRPNGSDCSGRRSLYVRDRGSGETTLIAGPDPTGHEPEFIRATPDGQGAYFLSYEQLDPSDSNTTQDIYRWDQAAAEANCLTCLVPDANVLGEGRKVFVSDDFSQIYFLSQAILVPGKGVEGDFNMYGLGEGQLRFIATVNAQLGTVRATSDGHVLVFPGDASRAVTSDETAAICPANKFDSAQTTCPQVFRYELEEESIECLSCDPNGLTTWSGVHFPTGLSYLAVDMSADGSFVALGTREPLTPQDDINGSDDVYEWHNGALRLVTDGTTEFPEGGFGVPSVKDVSDDGSTILYSAPEPGLTGYERDGLVNLYVARVGGGFPRPAVPTHCSEEACQGPLVPPPPERVPGSALAEGRGNVPSNVKRRRACRKKVVRRRGHGAGRRARCSSKKKQESRRGQKRTSHRNGGRGK